MKTGFDRSRFKGAKVSSNKQVQDEVNSANSKFSNRNSRPGYHDIDEGKNVFRIAPPHNSDEPSMQPKSVSWLPQLVKEESGKEVIKNKALFNARVHGISKDGLPITKDPIEEYVSYVYKMLSDEITDKKQFEKAVAPLIGYKDPKSGKWTPGIKPSATSVCYAWKNGKLGRLELRESITKKMDACLIDEDDKPMEIDPFSDPDNGVSLIIVYSPKETDNSKKYTVNRGSQPRPVTDEQLEELSKEDSLSEMFRDAYDMGTYNKVILGLKIIDDENEFGAFNHGDFLDILAEIKSQVQDQRSDPADVDAAEADVDPAPVASKKTFHGDVRVTPKVKDTPLPVVGDAVAQDFYSMSRKQLMAYIKASDEIAPVDMSELDDDELRAVIFKSLDSDREPTSPSIASKETRSDEFLEDMNRPVSPAPARRSPVNVQDVRDRVSKMSKK